MYRVVTIHFQPGSSMSGESTKGRIKFPRISNMIEAVFDG